MQKSTLFTKLWLAALMGSPLCAWAEPHYTTTFLPDWLSVSTIDNAGQMTGVMRVPGGSRAFLYTNGDVRDLGTLGGPTSFAYRMSNSGGLVTGDSGLVSGGSHAFLYANGAMRDLGVPPGGVASVGLAVNDAGQVTGSAVTSDNQNHAMLAAGGTMRDLGTLGGTFSYGIDINNAGHVVGASTFGPNDELRHAYVYRDGVMTDLGDFGGIDSFAAGINDRDQIIGGVRGATGNFRFFLYADGVVNYLGSLGGDFTSTWDINNLGQVVGFSTRAHDNDAQRGFLYTDGKMYDLNSLIDPALGWTVYTAVSINDAQQIVGYACRSSNVCRPVRLDPVSAPPVPEPGRGAMLLTGLALGGLRLGARRLPRR